MKTKINIKQTKIKNKLKLENLIKFFCFLIQNYINPPSNTLLSTNSHFPNLWCFL